MSAEQNAATLRRVYDATRNADLDALDELFSPDAALHVPGRSANTGTYMGPDEIKRFLAHTAQYTQGTLKTSVHRILADDEYAMALATYTATRDDGGALENNLVHVVRFAGGRIVESWFYSRDQYDVDAFWGAR